MKRYDAPPNAQSQCGRILRVLQAHSGAWVPLPEILALGIAQYGTRIKELRDDWGFLIENRTEAVEGERHSWFRLVPSKQNLESDYMRRIREEQARATPLFDAVAAK